MPNSLASFSKKLFKLTAEVVSNISYFQLYSCSQRRCTLITSRQCADNYAADDRGAVRIRNSHPGLRQLRVSPPCVSPPQPALLLSRLPFPNLLTCSHDNIRISSLFPIVYFIRTCSNCEPLQWYQRTRPHTMCHYLVGH